MSYTGEDLSQPLDERRLVGGYPKTGRTWLRYMLAESLVAEHGLGIDVDLTNVYNIIPNDKAGLVPGQPTFAYKGQVPQIEMTHASYHAGLRASANTIFLTRDPRDVLVSHWLHNKNQIHRFSGELSEFVHDPKMGIDGFLSHLDSWSPHLDDEQVITYEGLKLDPLKTLKRVVAQLKVSVDDSALELAVEKGEMAKMRNKELSKGIAGHNYDKTNPEALRVRRGKVGGFVDYLAPSDIEFIAQQISAAKARSKGIIALTGYFQER